MVLHIDAYLYQGDEEAFVSIPAGHLAADFNNTGINLNLYINNKL